MMFLSPILNAVMTIGRFAKVATYTQDANAKGELLLETYSHPMMRIETTPIGKVMMFGSQVRTPSIGI